MNALAEFFSPLIKRQLDANREILVTVGASQALDLAARAFIDPGDEILVFEPYFPAYSHFIRLSGGKLIPVPLRPKVGTTGHHSSDWTFNYQELELKINNRTKIIWLNNPNNPLGKVSLVNQFQNILISSKTTRSTH